MAKVLVTGSSDGIGKETARQLSAGGVQVIVHGRSGERAAEAARETGAAGSWVCDFTSLEDIRRAVGRLPKDLDVVINNAGVYLQQRSTTKNGYETTFQVNHLAPFLLTNLLLPALPAGSRIVNVSSQVHGSGQLAWDDLMGEQRFSGYAAYAQSKLANILFTRELARRQKKVTVNALHPGVIGTKLLRSGFGGMGGSPLARGAETPVYLATSIEVEGVTGSYFVNRRETRPSPQALDETAAQRLWDLSERLVEM